jgi:hypothetical protein
MMGRELGSVSPCLDESSFKKETNGTETGEFVAARILHTS